MWINLSIPTTNPTHIFQTTLRIINIWAHQIILVERINICQILANFKSIMCTFVVMLFSCVEI